MGFFKNLKRSVGMAKRFKGGIKKEVATIGDQLDQIVKEAELDEDIPKGKKSKEDFLKSKGLHGRPNSHMAIKAWEDYQDSFYDI